MSILTHSPAIVRDGLVLCLDAGAVRSYPIFRGSNLITNGEFTTDTTGWAGYGGTTVSRVTASSDPGVPSGGTDDYCLKVSGTFMAYDPISTTTGKHYFVRLRGYDASGGNSLKISNTSDGASLTGVSSVTVSGAEWKTYTSSFIAEGTTTYIRVGANSGGGGVSYWDKIEVYEAVWADLTGQSNDGVINGIDALSAASGAGGTKYFDFDGTSSGIITDTADFRSGDSAGTMAAWFSTNALDAYQVIVGSFDFASTTRYIEIFLLNNGKVAFAQCNSDTGDYFYYNSALAASTWYHVAVTSNGSSYALYVNGAEVTKTFATGSDTGDWFAETTARDNFCVGVLKYNSTHTNWLNGRVAIVHQYNRALTAAEIQQNYRTHKGRFGL